LYSRDQSRPREYHGPYIANTAPVLRYGDSDTLETQTPFMDEIMRLIMQGFLIEIQLENNTGTRSAQMEIVNTGMHQFNEYRPNYEPLMIRNSEPRIWSEHVPPPSIRYQLDQRALIALNIMYGSLMNTMNTRLDIVPVPNASMINTLDFWFNRDRLAHTSVVVEDIHENDDTDTDIHENM